MARAKSARVMKAMSVGGMMISLPGLRRSHVALQGVRAQLQPEHHEPNSPALLEAEANYKAMADLHS